MKKAHPFVASWLRTLACLFAGMVGWLLTVWIWQARWCPWNGFVFLTWVWLCWMAAGTLAVLVVTYPVALLSRGRALGPMVAGLVAGALMTHPQGLEADLGVFVLPSVGALMGAWVITECPLSPLLILSVLGWTVVASPWSLGSALLLMLGFGLYRRSPFTAVPDAQRSRACVPHRLRGSRRRGPRRFCTSLSFRGHPSR